MTKPAVDEKLLAELDVGEVLLSALRHLFRRLHVFLAAGLVPLAFATAFCGLGCCLGVVVVAGSGAEDAQEGGRIVGGLVGAGSMIVFMLLGFLPVAMQTHVVLEAERGGDASFFAALRALPGMLGAYVPVVFLVASTFVLGSALCLLPGVLALGFLGLAPVVAVAEREGASEALLRGYELARALGMRAFFPPLLHAVAQVSNLVLFAFVAYAFDAFARGATNIGVILVVELVFFAGAWLTFTYFVVAVPAVLYVRLHPTAPERVEGLVEVFR